MSLLKPTPEEKRQLEVLKNSRLARIGAKINSKGLTYAEALKEVEAEDAAATRQ